MRQRWLQSVHGRLREGRLMRARSSFRTGTHDEATNDLVGRFVDAIHEHAEAEHEASPKRGGPSINGALAIAAMTQVAAELILNVPPGPQRDELIAYREAVFSAVLESAATGKSVDVNFVPLGATH
ncbi:hypothetical protein D8770_26135 [Methylobacterium sp. DB1607]|nr:hypothetical protein [Methylobacterium sp. DB1607]